MAKPRAGRLQMPFKTRIRPIFSSGKPHVCPGYGDRHAERISGRTEQSGCPSAEPGASWMKNVVPRESTVKRSSLRNARRLAINLVAAVLVFSIVGPARAGDPKGQLTWAATITIAPTWFDPAETAGLITPYQYLYALHDAVVKPMPGEPFALSLAKSWSLSDDGLVHEFVLRDGAKFHNGEPVTSEDVKFSFERYRGAASKPIKDRVAAIETPEPGRVLFRLKQPWPDFMTFYAKATGAAWVVPKKYVQSVGDEGFKKAPVGAGPYKFVSFAPGIELTMEAFESYWRKTPSVKRLIVKVIPD